MKKLLLFFLLFPLSVLSQEWEMFFSNTAEDVFHYDKESLKVSGEKRSVLMVMDYGTPYDDGILSNVLDLEMNCDQQTIEIKTLSFYPLRMGKGELMASHSLDLKENVSTNDNNAYRSLLDTLCDAEEVHVDELEQRGDFVYDGALGCHLC